METLKTVIISDIALLGFVAAIMWACDTWDTRVFIVYAVTVILVTAICVLLYK